MSVSRNNSAIKAAAEVAVTYAPIHWGRVLDRELRTRGLDSTCVWDDAKLALKKEVRALLKQPERYGPVTRWTRPEII